MPAPEPVCCRPEPHGDGGRLVRVPQAGEAVADVDRTAVRVDVAQPDEDVGERQARTEEDLRAHFADDFHVFVEHGRGVGEDVGTGFQRRVVLKAAQHVVPPGPVCARVPSIVWPCQRTTGSPIRRIRPASPCESWMCPSVPK